MNVVNTVTFMSFVFIGLIVINIVGREKSNVSTYVIAVVIALLISILLISIIADDG